MDDTFNFTLPGEVRGLCCHLCVDEKTNIMLAAYIEYEETTNGYFKCLAKVLRDFGVPKKIVTDNRSTFRNNMSKNDETIFTKAIAQLDIEIETSSNCRRKNKVESKNDVFKDRVMKELVLRGVNTIGDAELEIDDVLSLVNDRLDNTIDELKNEFLPLSKDVNLDLIFASISDRTIQRDNTIVVDKINYLISRDGNA